MLWRHLRISPLIRTLPLRKCSGLTESIRISIFQILLESKCSLSNYVIIPYPFVDLILAFTSGCKTRLCLMMLLQTSICSGNFGVTRTTTTSASPKRQRSIAFHIFSPFWIKNYRVPAIHNVDELPFRPSQDFWRHLELIFSPEFLRKRTSNLESSLESRNWLCTLYLYNRHLEN